MPPGVLPLVLGFLLDILLGDPHWLPHPVRWMGWGIAKGEGLLRPIFPQTPEGELVAGGLLTLLVTASVYLSARLLLGLAGAWLGPAARLAVETVMCYQILATKSLWVESHKVYHALRSGDLAQSRQAVSMIVGRDTTTLSMEGVAKAGVETVAENASDGVVAPLLFLALGGAPLGFFYKAVNTLDSMIGYRSDRYLHFGRVAARLDDLANVLPSRLAGLLMIAAATPLGMDARGAARVFWRDRLNHASPNSGHTEAACAGALGVQLGGPATYKGVLHQKPTLGDATRPIEAQDIVRANRLMVATAVLALGLAVLLRFVW